MNSTPHCTTHLHITLFPAFALCSCLDLPHNLGIFIKKKNSTTTANYLLNSCIHKHKCWSRYLNPPAEWLWKQMFTQFLAYADFSLSIILASAIFHLLGAFIFRFEYILRYRLYSPIYRMRTSVVVKPFQFAVLIYAYESHIKKKNHFNIFFFCGDKDFLKWVDLWEYRVAQMLNV